MRNLSSVALFSLLLLPGAGAYLYGVDDLAANIHGLPGDAIIIEVHRLPPSARPDRELVLWMEHPKRYPRDYRDRVYTCPDVTRGSFYRGPTRVSLVDTRYGAILNTVEIVVERWPAEEDSFDIPFWIEPKYYRVPPPLRGGEGKPEIISLRDYNGDGQAVEFALYDAMACSTVDTQLVGYSIKTDRVIRYPVRLNGEWLVPLPSTVHWLGNWLTRAPNSPGYWHYTEDYNSGGTCVFDIRYRGNNEAFEATVKCR